MSMSQLLDVYGAKETPKGDIVLTVAPLFAMPRSDEVKACTAVFKALQWSDFVKKGAYYGVHIVLSEKRLLFETTNGDAWISVSVAREEENAVCGEAWIGGEEMEKFIMSKQLCAPVITPDVSAWPAVWELIEKLELPDLVKPASSLSSAMLAIPSRIDAALGSKGTGVRAPRWDITLGATALKPVWITALVLFTFQVFGILMPMRKD